MLAYEKGALPAQCPSLFYIFAIVSRPFKTKNSQMKKNMQTFCKFLMQTIAFLLLSVAAMAQNVVSGKVTDANGAAVPGTTVALKGTSTATQTLSDGTFKITTPKSTGVLVFSSVGFSSKEVTISGTTMNVS